MPEQAQKLEPTDDLVGSIAHDFNNLLQIFGITLQRLAWGNPLETDIKLADRPVCHISQVFESFFTSVLLRPSVVARESHRGQDG